MLAIFATLSNETKKQNQTIFADSLGTRQILKIGGAAVLPAVMAVVALMELGLSWYQISSVYSCCLVVESRLWTRCPMGTVLHLY